LDALEPNPGGPHPSAVHAGYATALYRALQDARGQEAQLQSQIKALDKIRAAEERQVTKFDFRVTLSIRRPSGGD